MHKAIPVDANVFNCGKTIFSKFKGIIYDYFKKIWPRLKKTVDPLVLKPMGIIVAPPKIAQ